MPIAVSNVILAVSAVLAAHWGVWFYLDLGIGFEKAVWEFASGGFVGAVLVLLPEANRKWVRDRLDAVLGSRTTTSVLLAGLVVALSVGFIFAKTTIILPSGTDSANINGVARTALTIQGGNTIEIFLPTYSLVIAEVSDLRQSTRARPFLPSKIQFSENELNTHAPLYKEVQDNLLLTFFQYFEKNFLTLANDEFSTPGGQNFRELNKIYSVLRRCFVDADLNHSADATIETYSAEHPKSVWIKLTRSCILYSRRQFQDAAQELENFPTDLLPEFRTTYLFFRGVNRLKLYGASAVSQSPVSGLGEEIINDFDDALAAAEGHTVFFDIARQSSEIFRGITCVYLSKLDTALSSFILASGGTYPGLRSRAYNDIGYVYMIEGNLPAAEEAFRHALEIEGSYPSARVNLAYVKMALAKFDDARAILKSAIADPSFRQGSISYLLLAKAGLAHLVMLTGPSDPAAYDDVMDSMKLYKYEDESNPQVRLARIHRSLAANLYTGKEYYGLEVFAMAMEAYAYIEADRAFSSEPTESTAALRAEALQNFTRLQALVNPSWFKNRHELGFFAPIYKLLDARPN